MKRLIHFLATLGPIGYFPIACATLASLVVTVIGWFLPVPPLPWAIAAIVVGGLIAVPICTYAEKDLGHDAHPIVIDEVIGQSIALLLVPHTWQAFLAAFLLFRLFDVWKPLGARESQAWPGGWGIVGDDTIAGLASFAVMQLGLWAFARLGVPMP
ncbi:MAG TPA: phosphatidylglycerophosphatase A [Candidatus Eisenbacteria bacterium]|nr:phosphatidylglycerophosphatase A [Candidatus Eisenbacteria bacterium]